MLVPVLVILLPVTLSRNITDEENRKLKSNCGAHFLNESRIEVPRRHVRSIGGKRAQQNEFPWIVGFYYERAVIPPPYKIKKWGCSGVQISNYHVLTAAHCVAENSQYLRKFCAEKRPNPIKYDPVDPSFLTLFIGSGCTNPELCKHNRTKYSVEEVSIHEDYDPCDMSNDLAVLEISPAISHQHGSPICMPQAEEKLDYNLTAVGFGLDPETKPTERTLLSDLKSVVLHNYYPFQPKVITTVSVNGSICDGGFGGPLTHNKDYHNYTAVGIAIKVQPLCTQSTLGVRKSFFTDLPFFIDWICFETGVCPISSRG